MQTLARIAFFKDATDIELERFDRACHWRRYDPDEVVVDFEDSTTDVYFIVTGEVRVLVRTINGKEVIFGEMRAGQFFGELTAIDGAKRSANVTALTRCELCVVPGAVFREIMHASPIITDKIMRLLTGRIRELNLRLTEHALLDLKHRLYSELLRLSAPRNSHEGERVVTPPPYHHVLAARIGCRREQVTRELSALANEGIVERTRGAFVIHKPQVLEERIADALRDDD
jgi:CRP/FNR family transcriptional regulator, cyclic AMP receptor protein